METFWDKKAREIDESWAKVLTAHIPPVYKVVVLGHDDIKEAGLIRQFCTAGLSEVCDPFERVFRRTTSSDSQKCMIDLGEGESPNPNNAAEFAQWARSADGLFLVYNIASNRSFCWMQVLYELVRRFRELAFDDPVDFYNTLHTGVLSLPLSDPKRTLPTVLVGVRAIPHGTRQVFAIEAEELARKNGWGFVEVSVLDGSDVDIAFTEIARLIIAQRNLARQPEQPVGFEQQDLESDQDTADSVKQRNQAFEGSIVRSRSQLIVRCVVL
ncbi:Ras GTPase ras2 [Xylographa soralifera]|nr:Ras GTPase ras2 [Xylographa soralifera]